MTPFKNIVIFALFVVSSTAELVCYNCDDCGSSKAVIEPCGFSATVETTIWPGDPNYPWNTIYPPWWPGGLATPPITPLYPCDPYNPVYPCNSNNFPCYQDPNYPNICYPYPIYQCNPVAPVYPCYLNNNNVGGGLVTAPITPWWPAKGADFAEPTPASVPEAKVRKFGCLMSKSTVDNREVIRRSCAPLEVSEEDTCNKVTGGKHQRCSVCTSHLCNAGT